jgi:uncharacterized membrane protein
MAASFGAIAAGAALFEAALIPGLAIGGAAVLAPRVWPDLRRRLRPLFRTAVNRRIKPAVAAPNAKLALPRLAIKQAVAKTITFRVIVTTLDFSANFVVIGELATAAGLSGFTLVVGPVFYLLHETAWNYLGPPLDGKDGRFGTAVDLSAFLPVRRDAKARRADGKRFTVSRPLAKTITFRTIATAMDFTTNYVVVGDLATAVTLSAFGFVAGPFIYIGHEMAWDHYASRRESVSGPPNL